MTKKKIPNILSYLKYFNLLTLLSIFILLSGCGFHFIKSSPDSQPMKIQLQTDQPDTLFTGILIAKMKNSKITTQEQKQPNTNFFVLISPVKNKQQITDLSGNALAGTYIDSYSVTITIINLKSKTSNNKNNTQTITLTSQRSYSSNATLELSQQSQNINIRTQAYQDLSQQIIDQLNIIYQKEQISKQNN